jgi:hypothetical protein
VRVLYEYVGPLWGVLLPIVTGVVVLTVAVFRSRQAAVWRYWPLAMVGAVGVAVLPPLLTRDWRGSPWSYLLGIAILSAFAVTAGATMAWMLARAGVRPSGRAAAALAFGLGAAIAGPFLLLVLGCLWAGECV